MAARGSATIYYGGLAARGGGAFMHARLLAKELEREGWGVQLVTLERLPLPLRYLPHLLGRAVNRLFSPMGFYAKDRLTRFLYRRLLGDQAQLRIFEDIYLAWNSPVPTVTVLHATWSDNLQALAVSRNGVRRLVAAEERAIDSIAHPIITVSDEYRQFLLNSHGYSRRLHSVSVVPLGLDMTEFAGVVRGTGSSRSLVFCGSLEARKNLRFLLDVLRDLYRADSAYRLTIIGDGPDKGTLERYAADHALPVDFRGRLGRSEMIEELRRHTVYVHPSVKESFSFALLEAKMAGLKTVAYEGLEVPAEFIDVPVPSFETSDWSKAIIAAPDARSKPVDAQKYSSRRMMLETVDLAFAGARAPRHA